MKEKMKLFTVLSINKELRHAEFISASMARGLMMVRSEQWTLKQVQGDEGF